MSEAPAPERSGPVEAGSDGAVTGADGRRAVAEPDVPRHRRGPRRASVPGTGPEGADRAEPRIVGLNAKPSGAVVPEEGRPDATDARGRWILDQRPPHWG